MNKVYGIFFMGEGEEVARKFAWEVEEAAVEMWW